MAPGSLMLATTLWVVALLVDPGPLAPWSLFLAGLGLLTVASVSTVGMTVSGARWAWRTALGALGYTLALAVVRPIDAWWVAAISATAISGLLLVGAGSTGMRRLPTALGPPPASVLLSLTLLAAPALLGLAAWDQPGYATVVVGCTATLSALWYSRVLYGGLALARVGWPAVCLALAWWQPLAALLVTLILAALVAILAWRPEVKTAFHPPRERGTAYPIPPELAPPEILDAARLDERGRPR